jgi:CheY-like chemotaxis protein
MGLSISYGIVKRFGGTITVYSRPGQGAIFTVYLPAMTPREQWAVHDITRMPKGTEHVLLLGGNDLSNAVPPKFLKELGYRVTVIPENGMVENLLQCDAHFDLMIIDLMEPDLWIEEAYPQIRNALPMTPVVALIGYGHTGQHTFVPVDQVHATLSKPVILGELAQLIRNVMTPPSTA